MKPNRIRKELAYRKELRTQHTALEFDERLLELLVCPRCRLPLALEDSNLTCEGRHQYAVIEGIPILLLSDVAQMHIESTRSVAVAEQGDSAELPQFEVRPGMIDGYFSLNPQFSDRRFLPRKYQAVVLSSEMLRPASGKLPMMANFADSLYLASVRN